MDVTGIYQCSGVSFTSNDNSLWQGLFFNGFAFLFSALHSMCNGRLQSVLCLFTPALWREWNVFVGLPYLFACRPASRSVLTVTNSFALDIVEVIDVSEQRYAAENSEHGSSDQD